MKFYRKEQPYLEVDASGVILGAGLLQVRDKMQFPEDEAPDNSALRPIALTSKNLTNSKTFKAT